MDTSKLKKKALDYHKAPVVGKIALALPKPLDTPDDLTLAYSPGVAYACQEIQRDPAHAATLTSRSHLIGVITNGTAVLGLGNIGPLAAKPVMEGKAVLFKKFGGLDAFDLEIDEPDPVKLADHIARLAPTFGGINLEDIKAPDCFIVERLLKERLTIPVFHDDQHGTAIVVAAAIQNGLELTGKKLSDAKVVVSGAGSAALACLEFLLTYGLNRARTFVFDSKGLITKARKVNDYKAPWASTETLNLTEAMKGADIFLGLSKGDILSPSMLASMAPNPLVLALANPAPEVNPEFAHATRSDLIMATGRSDYPNQVNNVLCFPYIFRGALNAGATQITESMKRACADALAALPKQPLHRDNEGHTPYQKPFSKEALIPHPFDPRLLAWVTSRVAAAA